MSHQFPTSVVEAAPQLVLNVFPVSFSTQKVSVWSGRWRDTETADSLADTIPGLVTWRDPTDADRVYAWHPDRVLAEGVPNYNLVTVAAAELPQLFERLLMDAVRARFLSLGFTEKHNGFVNYGLSVLDKIPALAAATSEPIGIHARIVTDALYTRDVCNRLVFGLAVDVLYCTRLEVNLAEWVGAGLAEDIIGTYVCLLPGGGAAARYPNLIGRSIGKVDGLRGDRVVLTDLKEAALADLALTEVAPEPRRIHLERYLLARYAKAYRAGERDLTERLRKLVRPAERNRLIDAAVSQRLLPSCEAQAASLPILPGVTASLGVRVRTDAKSFPSRELKGPTFSFDHAGSRTHTRVDIGLQRHGPYDQERIEHQAMRILVVAPASNKGDVQQTMQRLREGVPTPQRVFTGLQNMYGLKNLVILYEWADVRPSSPMAGYADAIQQGIRTACEGGKKLDLVIVVIQASHRTLPDAENPYFQSKGLVLALEGVPTQMITIEKLRQKDQSLQYILNTAALACYAKLGGTSHVLQLPEADSAPTELVFGVGRAMTREERFDPASETIGFATVFRANGEYLYNDCTPYCDGANYERALEDTIRRSVERTAAFEQLVDGSPLRLVFHVPRRTGRREVQPILNAVGKLTRYKIEFALLHVNDDHSLQLFDPTNVDPVTSRGELKPEAAFLPPRGVSVTLGPRERLVTFVGIDQYRGHGSPSPLRITLDRHSTFTDLDYLTQQLYWLSFMSIASLSPGVLPATMSYAERLAGLTGHLRRVQPWSVELIRQKLTRKLWFI